MQPVIVDQGPGSTQDTESLGTGTLADTGTLRNCHGGRAGAGNHPPARQAAQ